MAETIRFEFIAQERIILQDDVSMVVAPGASGVLAQDDYEACIAAHYVARHQPSFEENLRWNQESLARAEAVGDERVRDFYPSLLLNLGHSYEILGDAAEARKYYDLAVERVDELPPGPYSDVVRRGISAAQQRIGKQGE